MTVYHDYTYIHGNNERAVRAMRGVTKPAANSGMRIALSRIALVVIIAGIIIAIGMAFRADSAAALSEDYNANVESIQISAPVEPVYSSVVDVEPGDTLWSIAKQNMPSGMNVRHYIDEIKQLNGLTNSVIYEGMLLYMPQH